MKLIIASDNHLRKEVLKEIVQNHPSTNYFIHCGDSQMPPQEIKPFIGVKGNNDYYQYPKKRIIQINEYFTMLVIHGDGVGYLNLNAQLKKLAIENGCNIVCYGHTHVPVQILEDGIYLFNPGSTSYPRSMIGRTYMKIEIEGDQLLSEIIKLS